MVSEVDTRKLYMIIKNYFLAKAFLKLSCIISLNLCGPLLSIVVVVFKIILLLLSVF